MGQVDHGARIVASGFGRCVAFERSMNALVIVIGLKIVELTFKMESIPEEDMVEILSAYRPYQLGLMKMVQRPNRTFVPSCQIGALLRERLAMMN
jgi:hypothetical protein